jgi:SAM-dependent methyltransferase
VLKGILSVKLFPLVSRRRLNAAIKGRASALAESDIARAERDAARAESDAARAERDVAHAESDAARAERDAAHAESDAFRDYFFRSVAHLFDANAIGNLMPVAVCRNHNDWHNFLLSDQYALIGQSNEALISSHRFEETWGIAGYSIPAHQVVIFKVDMLGRGRRIGNEFHPNIKERFECPVTGLNNRQRLVAALIEGALSKQKNKAPAIYCMEQVTPFFAWMKKEYPYSNVVGSEFLGENLTPGQIVDDIRHENLHELSFRDASIDLVISNDVMEHVLSPPAAFRELARVMRDGSEALMTFPFSPDLDNSVTRAEVVDGEIMHLREPIYHGNPVSQDGSLVFTDFGWDIFDLAKQCGFKDMSLEIYHSVPLGHLGLALVFRFVR